MDKVFDLRFSAPVGVMIFFIFLFSPSSFILLVMSLSKFSWIISFTVILGIGFIISSLANFYTVKFKKFLPNESDSQLKKAFGENRPEFVKNNDARELANWMVLDSKRRFGSDFISNQIQKRWNFAMLNLNCFVAVILGFIVTIILSCFCILSFPGCVYFIVYLAMIIAFISLFWHSSEIARLSVLEMERILSLIGDKGIIDRSHTDYFEKDNVQK
jgi:hypothetical protein